MSNSEKLIYFSLSFIGGICIASYFFSFSIIVFLIGIFLLLFKGKEKIIIVGICCIFFSLGMFHFENEFKKNNENFLINFDKKEVILTGVISGEVKKGNDKTQMIVDVFDKGKAVGKALVFTDKHSFYKYRDKIKIEGKILVPQNLDGFDYRGYLSKSGVVVTISYPKIDIVERKYYSNFFQKFQYFVYEFKDSRSEKIKDLMPPKLSPILEAMILGNDSKMSKEVKENLSKSGLSHAIAISGSHIVLFSAMIFWVLLFLGFWRKHAIIFSMMFTLFYVFFVGMMASAFRAGIMMTMLFIAELFDRKAFNLRTLILAAFIMLIFNPLLLKYDLGFQLSFLAVLGIILMAPIFNQWLSFIKWNYLREIIAVTLTAQIFTLPILISSFGYFSIISIVTNILIAPIIAPLMGLGILIPFLPHFLSFLLSIPCTLLLSYLMWVVDFSAQIPFAVLNIKIPIIFLLFLYAPLFLISHKMKKKDLDFLGQ